MNFVTYTATPGLERFPELERFRVWRAVHKRLKHTDLDYRRKLRWFLWRILGTNILFLVPTFALGHFKWPPLWVQVPAYIILLVVYVLYQIRDSFNLQWVMNEKVGQGLLEQP